TARRADNRKGLAPPLNTCIKNEKGQSAKMITVEMAYDDQVNIGSTQLVFLQSQQGCRPAIDQKAIGWAANIITSIKTSSACKGISTTQDFNNNFSHANFFVYVKYQLYCSTLNSGILQICCFKFNKNNRIPPLG